MDESLITGYENDKLLAACTAMWKLSTVSELPPLAGNELGKSVICDFVCLCDVKLSFNEIIVKFH